MATFAGIHGAHLDCILHLGGQPTMANPWIVSVPYIISASPSTLDALATCEDAKKKNEILNEIDKQKRSKEKTHQQCQNCAYQFRISRVSHVQFNGLSANSSERKWTNRLKPSGKMVISLCVKFKFFTVAGIFANFPDVIRFPLRFSTRMRFVLNALISDKWLSDKSNFDRLVNLSNWLLILVKFNDDKSSECKSDVFPSIRRPSNDVHLAWLSVYRFWISTHWQWSGHVVSVAPPMPMVAKISRQTDIVDSKCTLILEFFRTFWLWFGVLSGVVVCCCRAATVASTLALSLLLLLIQMSKNYLSAEKKIRKKHTKWISENKRVWIN